MNDDNTNKKSDFYEFSHRLSENLLKGEDGFFKIEYKDAYAFLAVYPPGPGGKVVQTKDIFNRLKVLKIKIISEEKIEAITKKQEGKLERLGAWPEGKPSPWEIVVSLSSDKMEAFVKLIPGNRSPVPEFTEILNTIKYNSIDFGILENEIHSILSKKIYYQELLIAKGQYPKKGKDGFLKYKFSETKLPSEDLEEVDGKVDYRKIQMIRCVGKGEEIGTLQEASKGIPGYTVTSEFIPAVDGKSYDVHLGRNTSLADDAKTLLADVSGHIVFEQGICHVEEICRLEAVDFSTGNIVFNGTVAADKISNGFQVEAKSSIQVREGVQKVFLYAKKDIILGGGARGGGEGIIEAGENIQALYAENVNLLAGGDLRIIDGLIHTQAMIDGNLILSGPRGDIIGGNVICGGQIEASKLGAVAETKTEIHIGIPPEVIRQLFELKKEYENAKEVRNKIMLTLGPNQSDDKKISDKENPEVLDKLKVLLERYIDKIKSVKKQMDHIINSYEPNSASKIIVREAIYPGVIIYFGRQYRVFRGKAIFGKFEITLLDGEVNVF